MLESRVQLSQEVQQDLDRQYELRLTAEPQRLGIVRRIVSAHLRHWNLTYLVDPALLGVTELIGNVHRHVGSQADCLLRISAADGCLRCEVRDGSPTLPRLLNPDEEDDSGRGLHLVAALSKEWGAEVADDGKVVWFALETTLCLAERAGRQPELVEPAQVEPDRVEPAPVETGLVDPDLVDADLVDAGLVDPGRPAAPLRIAPLGARWAAPPQEERGRVPVRARA